MIPIAIACGVIAVIAGAAILGLRAWVRHGLDANEADYMRDMDQRR